MPVDRKYGRVTVENKETSFVDSGYEPVFIIRAQDKLSATAIGEYSAIAREAGASAEFLDLIDSVRMDFESWQLHNSSRVKMPD